MWPYPLNQYQLGVAHWGLIGFWSLFSEDSNKFLQTP